MPPATEPTNHMPEEFNEDDRRAEFERMARLGRYKTACFSERLPKGEGFCCPVDPINRNLPMKIHGKLFRLTDTDVVLTVYYAQAGWVEVQNTKEEYYRSSVYLCYDKWRFFVIEGVLVQFFAVGCPNPICELAEAPQFLREWFQGSRKRGEYFVISNRSYDQDFEHLNEQYRVRSLKRAD